ncbi:unnamed protein product [Jaminaea pallidilutea]
MVDDGVRYWDTYDPTHPPPPTSESHVRFVIISDTHSTEPPDIPPGDVLLHSGDLTALGDEVELKQQLDWLSSLPHPIKVIIGGNHDLALDSNQGWYESRGASIHRQFGYPLSDPAKARSLFPKPDGSIGLHYLEHESVEVAVQRPAVSHRKWKIFGSPYTPWFRGWAWNYERGSEAKALYSNVPRDTDILLTHGPPHSLGDLDAIYDGSHVGCEELTRKGDAGELQPRLWCFGHIHEARGVCDHQWPGSKSSKSLLVNSAMVDFDMAAFRAKRKLMYRVRHQPIIVDVPAGPTVASDPLDT